MAVRWPRARPPAGCPPHACAASWVRATSSTTSGVLSPAVPERREQQGGQQRQATEDHRRGAAAAASRPRGRAARRALLHQEEQPHQREQAAQQGQVPQRHEGEGGIQREPEEEPAEDGPLRHRRPLCVASAEHQVGVGTQPWDAPPRLWCIPSIRLPVKRSGNDKGRALSPPPGVNSS